MVALNPWRIFQSKQQTLILKIPTYGDAQSKSLIQDYKAIWLDWPSGNPNNVQGYILVTQHFMQYLLELSPMGTLGLPPSPGYNPDVSTGMTDVRHYSVQKST